MARTAGSKNKKPQLDPLLAALIARLPARPGWPAADRTAWLLMMETAFDVVYGINVGDRVMAKPNGRDVAVIAAKPEDHAFYIDREGFARGYGHQRIDAHEVDGILFDLRGEGDLGAIVWADGSKGVLGKVLDIRPA